MDDAVITEADAESEEQRRAQRRAAERTLGVAGRRQLRARSAILQGAWPRG